jgi:hypothetical protein
MESASSLLSSLAIVLLTKYALYILLVGTSLNNMLDLPLDPRLDSTIFRKHSATSVGNRPVLELASGRIFEQTTHATQNRSAISLLAFLSSKLLSVATGIGKSLPRALTSSISRSPGLISLA